MFQMNNFKMPVQPTSVAETGASVLPTVPDIQIPANIIQTRELLYRLIISQLFYDGYQQVAVTLSNMGRLFPHSCCSSASRSISGIT